MNVYEQWIAAMKRHGHVPIMDNEEADKLNVWVYDLGHCNGPGCETCGMVWCMHCAGPESVEPCTRPAIDGVAG